MLPSLRLSGLDFAGAQSRACVNSFSATVRARVLGVRIGMTRVLDCANAFSKVSRGAPGGVKDLSSSTKSTSEEEELLPKSLESPRGWTAPGVCCKACACICAVLKSPLMGVVRVRAGREERVFLVLAGPFSSP